MRTPADFHPLSATFKNRDDERAYRTFLVESALPKERLVWAACNAVYVIYGFLDLLVITENLSAALAIRWGFCGPFAAVIVALTYTDRLKRWFPELITIGVGVAALSIVAMIAMMQADDPPAYLVGILVCFIFAACVLHMSFPLAAAMYASTALAYAAVLLGLDKFSTNQIISGLFFMISSASLAGLITYVQEIRYRIAWRQDRQREEDAARINELLVEATAADQSKMNFLSVLSHELKTPLHQIIGYADIVSDARSEPAAGQESGEAIRIAAISLLERIQKLLRFADASAGRIRYDKEDYQCGELVELTIEQMRATADKKRVTFDVANVDPAKLKIDIAHTSYALGAIVENAIKASPDGSVIRIIGARNDDAYILAIEDEGAGVPTEIAQRILQPFSQGDNVLKRNQEGLGLGLTLSKKILSDQGAELSIENRKRRGARVEIAFSEFTQAPTPSEKQRLRRAA